MQTLALIAVLALTGALVADEQDTPAQDQQILERGRSCTARFYAGQTESLWNDFGEAMRAGMGSQEALQGFQQQAFQQIGRETAVVDETVQHVDGSSLYTRTAHFDKLPQLFQVLWVFDKAGMVGGFSIQPVRTEAPSEYLEHQTRTDLQLPFEGEWHIFWGGRTLEDNYHTFVPDQRFAYDILIMRDGATHTGEGQRNEDYFCFGQPVLSPGAGVVVQVEAGVADNTPGQMNPAQAMGNHVIIDHGNGEYSFLAHFQQHSLAVEQGARVKAGDVLGRCGNSGNTTEPHIHYHVQDTPDFGQGQGMPSQFQDYLADGKPVERGEPVRGQTVSNSGAR